MWLVDALLFAGAIVPRLLSDDNRPTWGELAMGASALSLAAIGLVLLGSATCLNIMTRGAQPWIGLVYLAGNYVYGYLAAPNGD
ncbi:hypothetical protein QRX50_46260 [Amycolatopsis carbonis]|uniref:Uncharacterized protein n=1 Tax=Amycolatopsis carbonis TaxID=715471 RepID=A0A9Y2IEM5_9PSEU|nr:hypothetical protein [Amycolatopsis sp. 2-15]WIX78667.1 hypothetical protein QRX50_46260 [Amycolatopsis sp. 2-15]